MKKASGADAASSPSCRVGACADLGDSHTRSPQAATLPGKAGSSLSLWLWVAAGFLFLAVLWTALFVASRKIDSRTVPLATKEARP